MMWDGWMMGGWIWMLPIGVLILLAIAALIKCLAK